MYTFIKSTFNTYYGSDKYKEEIVLNAFKNELSNGSLMDIGSTQYNNDMYYKILEFCEMILDNNTSKSIDKLSISLDVTNVMDKVRRDINLVFPADK